MATFLATTSEELKEAVKVEPEEEEEDESEGDELVHEQMLESISALGKKRKANQRDEPVKTVSEYNLVHDEGHVLAEDLLMGLKNKSQLHRLKQRLAKVKARTVHLTTPLPVYLKDKIKRRVAYREASFQMSKWEAIIKHNRKAEHLVFPLQEEVVEQPSLSTKVDSFDPVTELECKVASMLEGSEHVIPNDKELSDAERNALMRMTVEEARERQKELRRMRVLMSYYEQKCKRIKRIKSRKFRKVLRKKKEKKKEMEDDDTCKSLEKAERLRAKERATLKHSNLSKWARSQLAKKHRDPATQQALAEQGRIKNDLKWKRSEYESSSSEEEVDENEAVVCEDENEENYEVSNNRWLSNSVSLESTTPVLLLNMPSIAISSTKINASDVQPMMNKENVKGRYKNEKQEEEKREDLSFYQASQQRLAVEEAFAGDDVVEEFIKEKQEEVEESSLKEIDLTLPGWGQWGGMGTRPSTKKIVVPVNWSKAKPRRDFNMKHVIINEERDKKAAKHFVNKLPYPLTSQTQFNHVMSTPIGRQWNTETAFNDMVRPRIKTTIGAVVEPMKVTEEVEEFMRKSRRQVEIKKKRRQKR